MQHSQPIHFAVSTTRTKNRTSHPAREVAIEIAVGPAGSVRGCRIPSELPLGDVWATADSPTRAHSNGGCQIRSAQLRTRGRIREGHRNESGVLRPD